MDLRVIIKGTAVAVSKTQISVRFDIKKRQKIVRLVSTLKMLITLLKTFAESRFIFDSEGEINRLPPHSRNWPMEYG